MVSLHSEIGTINWVKQVGTDKNHELARHDAIGIDPAGNAILEGRTTGSFFRESDNDDADTSHIFVMVMTAEEGDEGPIGQPVAAPTDPPVEPTPPPAPLPSLAPLELYQSEIK